MLNSFFAKELKLIEIMDLSKRKREDSDDLQITTPTKLKSIIIDLTMDEDEDSDGDAGDAGRKIAESNGGKLVLSSKTHRLRMEWVVS